MDARSKALKHFRKEKRADRDMMELPVKKVSVMADSKEGLEEGLSKAKDILEEGPEGLLEDSMEEAAEDESSEEKDLGSCSHEELVEMVKDLKKQLEEKQS